MSKALLLTLLWLVPAGLSAQHMGGAHFAGRGRGYAPRATGRSYGRNGAFGVPFLDAFYGDDLGSPDQAAVPPPARYSPGAPPFAGRETPAPAAPLMIELVGDRYVQVSGNTVSSAQVIDRPAPDSSQAASAGLSRTPAEPEAAILVFRDGHRQEVSGYTIASGQLYASTDYYSSGAWNQTIALAALNLRETVSANQARGLRFRLPAAPNEVIVGP
jgi:hypothetical protein